MKIETTMGSGPSGPDGILKDVAWVQSVTLNNEGPWGLATIEARGRSTVSELRQLLDNIETDMAKNPGRRYRIDWESLCT